MVEEATVRDLLVIGAAVTMFGGPFAWLKVLDFCRDWKERRAPASHRFASIAWLDPDLRRN